VTACYGIFERRPLSAMDQPDPEQYHEDMEAQKVSTDECECGIVVERAALWKDRGQQGEALRSRPVYISITMTVESSSVHKHHAGTQKSFTMHFVGVGIYCCIVWKMK